MTRLATLLDGQQVRLVPRNELRFRLHGRFFCRPPYLTGFTAPPPVPAAFSGSKNRALSYPLLGNDQYGDCFYTAACHAAQTWTGQVGQEARFDAQAVIRRYLQISGGDNGLTDALLFPEWKGGVVGPAGPHRILDEMTVDPHDHAAIRRGLYYFCGSSWTAALPDAWIRSAAPGAVWGPGQPNPQNGHAMHLSGYTPDYYECETWGFNPAIRLSPAGLESADPEVILAFSLDLFDSRGIAPHCGLGYDDLAALWHSYGGATLPPNPFLTPPIPAPPAKLCTLTFRQPVLRGGWVSFRAPVPIPAGKVDLVPEAVQGNHPEGLVIAECA